MGSYFPELKCILPAENKKTFFQDLCLMSKKKLDPERVDNYERCQLILLAAAAAVLL